MTNQASGQSLPAISVRNVGKRYDIYKRNLDRVKQTLTGREYCSPFWALRNATFDVMPGEAVGIVGRNGSGKSTLMQIIAGTLTPTEGEVQIRGRIAALLELGSGFNPTFTGRENVYLAGAILGVPRREMDKRFADIVAFADIGDFLEQPVEVYSSGMHARLAFSVAISVEPDILIIDEILSVGDAGFQQKCVARLRQLQDKGVTLLFVSHSADAVKSICSRGLFLRKGTQEFFGPAGEAVDRYMASLRIDTTERAAQNAAARRPHLADAAPVPTDTPQTVTRVGMGHARVSQTRLLSPSGQPATHFALGERITVEVDITATVDVDRLDLVLRVRDKTGLDIFGTTAWDAARQFTGDRGKRALTAGEKLTFRFAFDNVLAAGPHGIALTLTRRPDQRGEGLMTLDHLDTAAAFESLAASVPVPGKVQVPVEIRVAQTSPTQRV